MYRFCAAAANAWKRSADTPVMQRADINEQYFIATDVDTSADSISAISPSLLPVRDAETRNGRTAEVHAGRPPR